jgi:DNA-directed RNA polymerase subunit RPC12/RpoP
MYVNHPELNDISPRDNGGQVDYTKHKKCETDGCVKYAARAGLCITCHNEAQGAVTKPGRKAGAHPKVTAWKLCADCRKEFKPTSNNSKRCPECKSKRHIDKYRHTQCSIEGCDNQAVKDGLCKFHLKIEQSQIDTKQSSSGTRALIEQLLEKRRKIDIAIEVLQEMSLSCNNENLVA